MIIIIRGLINVSTTSSEELRVIYGLSLDTNFNSSFPNDGCTSGCVTSSQMGALPFEKQGKVVIPEVHEIRYRVGFETDKMVKEAQEAIHNELS
jgi:hypothetical protein